MQRVLCLPLLLAVLAGCAGAVPDDPPVFHVDAIRYWWEGDDLIVNVTFTNIANYTPGVASFDPRISLIVYPEERRPGGGRIGDETNSLPQATESVKVILSAHSPAPWRPRWESGNIQIVGPVLIPPGTSLSMEFLFHPAVRFETERDGYYYILVNVYAGPCDYDHPYYTGCFNRVVAEFYGAKDGKPDCRIWDCTGEMTDYGYNFRNLKESYKPKCNATNATGPNYT